MTLATAELSKRNGRTKHASETHKTFHHVLGAPSKHHYATARRDVVVLKHRRDANRGEYRRSRAAVFIRRDNERQRHNCFLQFSAFIDDIFSTMAASPPL